MIPMKRTPLAKARLRWTEVDFMPIPGRLIRGFSAYTAPVPWEQGMIRVIVATPESPEGDWHLSISREPTDQYPSWDHIAQAREDFLPDEITFGMILPPRAEHVSLHPTTFHLHPLETRR